jgi:hypothetical protein
MPDSLSVHMTKLWSNFCGRGPPIRSIPTNLRFCIKSSHLPELSTERRFPEQIRSSIYFPVNFGYTAVNSKINKNCNDSEINKNCNDSEINKNCNDSEINKNCNEDQSLSPQGHEYPSPTSYSSVRVRYVSCRLLTKRQFII